MGGGGGGMTMWARLEGNRNNGGERGAPVEKLFGAALTCHEDQGGETTVKEDEIKRTSNREIEKKGGWGEGTCVSDCNREGGVSEKMGKGAYSGKKDLL